MIKFLLTMLVCSSVWAAELPIEVLKQEGNVVFSPYSAKVVLSMAAIGSKGATNDEIAAILGGFRIENFYGGFESAQAVIIDKDFRCSKLYQQRIKTYFGGKFFPCNLRDNDPACLALVNGWAASKTHNLIPTLLEPQDIDPNTVMLLLNAAYFKGKWASPFSPTSTKKAPFHGTTTSEVDMMQQEGYFSYSEDNAFSIIELPYRTSHHDNFATAIILPKEGKTLSEVTSSLTMEKIRKWLKMERHYVELLLPRFTLEYRADLRPILEKCGMKTAFSTAADFSEICPNKPLSMSKVIQAAHIRVNEAGTEASAATAASITMRSGPPEQKYTMRCDRPFLFLIYEKNTGAMLFMCRVSSLS